MPVNLNFCRMCSSTSASSLFHPNMFTYFLPRHRCIFSSGASIPFPSRRRNSSVRLGVSVVAERRDLEPTWLSSADGNDDYGGWAISRHTAPSKKKALPILLFSGIGTSVVALLGAIAYCTIFGKGSNFQYGSQLHPVQGMLNPHDVRTSQRGRMESDASNGDDMVPEASLEPVADVTSEFLEPEQVEKHERVIIPAAVDSTQQEALSVLEELKIIENDVKGGELCTRREYARWLVKANSVLERNPKHKIASSIILSGSTVAAFDDVSIEDSDFWCIQALAEAGIVLSKLSDGKSSYISSGLGGQGSYFQPDRYIARQDLIDWKCQLDYESMPEVMEKISNTKIGFLDAREISPDASPKLLMDMQAGEKSIASKVFGQSRRFQPNKPSTKAQAALALTSGRMTEAINAEILRLEVENCSRQFEMEEIKSELLATGHIQKIWDEKMKEQESRFSDIEIIYLAAFEELEQEKISREKNLDAYLKEKAAMDCQRQLLLTLKEEVHDMSERLEVERANYMAEKHDVQEALTDLQTQRKRLLDAKAILEAETEALRLLRSWIEDDARKSQARSKVLEEVGRRWKWDDET